MRGDLLQSLNLDAVNDRELVQEPNVLRSGEFDVFHRIHEQVFLSPARNYKDGSGCCATEQEDACLERANCRAGSLADRLLDRLTN